MSIPSFNQQAPALQGNDDGETIVLQIESEEQCADTICLGSGAGIATGGQGHMRSKAASMNRS